MDNRAQNRQKDNKDDRVPVSGIRDIMTLLNKEDSAYVYRWVVDVDERGSRIYKYKRGGWEFSPVKTDDGDMVVGQEAVYRSKQTGSIIRMQTGGGKFSYVMRIRKEFYDDDQKAKAESIDEVERAITGTGTSTGEDFGQYGKVSIERD